MLKVTDVAVERGQQCVLDDVTFELAPGKTLAVVGESGAGKTTLVHTVLGLLSPSRGTVTWCDASVRGCAALVMQEPRAAFNPALTLHRSVMEPLVARKQTLPASRMERLCADLELPPDLLNRRCGEVSIGQAQRIGILRALVSAPPLVLFDEPLSALDAVTQKRTARLIAELQSEEGFAALIVTHDLGYACAYADDIVLLRSGRVEEIGPAPEFARGPRTEYGRTLRNAAIALGALEQVR